MFLAGFDVTPQNREIVEQCNILSVACTGRYLGSRWLCLSLRLVRRRSMLGKGICIDTSQMAGKRGWIKSASSCHRSHTLQFPSPLCLETELKTHSNSTSLASQPTTNAVLQAPPPPQIPHPLSDPKHAAFWTRPGGLLNPAVRFRTYWTNTTP